NRVHDVMRRYGKVTVMACIREMLDRTERAVRTEIAAIPDGTYSGEASTDDDGTVLDQPVTVRLDITVMGDGVTLDFSRSDAQRKGFVNCPFAASYAIAVGSMMLLFDPTLADFHNEGSLRSINFIAPPGSVVHPLYPATVGAAPVNVGHQIATAVHDALAKARPNRVIAAWGKRRGDYVFATDPRTKQPYIRTTFDYDGSAGACTGHDGPTGPLSIGSLATVMRSNAEEMEMRFPWRLLKWEAATDLMGAGRWRGGGGIEWQALNEGSDGRMATGSSDGDMTPGLGVQGGCPSPASRTFVVRDGQPIRVKPHRMVEIKTGDILAKISGGGGGVGLPIDRPPELVALDVKNEMVSVEAARKIYGVAVDPVTFAVDEAETRRLRSQPQSLWDVVINEDTLAVGLAPHKAG
ncbi:MAG TPA: hydantoinase B/oxoprolinase family protein, partial [Steroidobacteraceae bacterium]|nr:hydantoinase B/oxoprolinase family protein [Steroidobacteraceae bacterium]